jgi:hypothetical protein
MLTTFTFKVNTFVVPSLITVIISIGVGAVFAQAMRQGEANQ